MTSPGNSSAMRRATSLFPDPVGPRTTITGCAAIPFSLRANALYNKDGKGPSSRSKLYRGRRKKSTIHESSGQFVFGGILPRYHFFGSRVQPGPFGSTCPDPVGRESRRQSIRLL